MKTTNLSIAMALVASIALGNDAKYEEAMTKNIDLVYKGQTVEEIQQAVNIFDRIGSAEKNKWEPFYYAAFGYVMLSTREQEASKKDSYLDQAQVAIDKATAIRQGDSEIVAMEGFIHMIRVSIDPAARGQKFSILAMQALGKAVELNPENPRALALVAQMQFGTARFFKASTDEACATTRKAIEKYNTFKPENSLSPAWGKGMAEGLLEQCQ